MKFNIGDKVIVSKRILTINYDYTKFDPPTREMKELVGKTATITKTFNKEYELDIMTGIYWMEEELDVGAVNKGEFTNIE